MIQKLAIDLCAGAVNSAPINCYKNIVYIDDGILVGLSVELCAGSRSSERTLSCYSQAWNSGMNRRGVINLCKAK